MFELARNWTPVMLVIFTTCPAYSQTTSNCTDVKRNYDLCVQKNTSTWTSLDLLSILQESCQTTECFLKCQQEAVGDCYMQETEFLEYDMPLHIANNRAICDNVDLFVDGLSQCDLFNGTCVRESNLTGMYNESITDYTESDFESFKLSFCQRNADRKRCIHVTNFSIDHNCTDEMVEFLNNLYTSLYSYYQCNSSRQNIFLDRYYSNLQSPTCPMETSGASVTTTSAQTQQSTSTTQTATDTTAQTQQSPVTTQTATDTTTQTQPSTSTNPTSTDTTTQTQQSPATSQTATDTTTQTQKSTSTTQTAADTTAQTQQSPATSQTATDSTTQTQKSTSTTQTAADTTAQTQQSPSTTQTTDPRCSWQNIVSRLSGCVAVTFEDMASMSDAMSSFCDELECNIQCYIDAIDECDLEDGTFYFDSVVYKVMSRAFCKSFSESVEAFIHCVMDDLNCITIYASELNAAMDRYNTNQNSTEMVTDYCSAASIYKSCIEVTPSESCTSQMAAKFKGLATVSASYKKCGPQSHAYFNRFGGEVTCGSYIAVPLYSVLVLSVIYSWLLSVM